MVTPYKKSHPGWGRVDISVSHYMVAKSVLIQFASQGENKILQMNMSNLNYKCRGHWGYILKILAPELSSALNRAPFHVPCPMHGGKDGFRFFPDYRETGGAVCNTCGVFPNGFRLLSTIHGWSKDEMINKVLMTLMSLDNSTGYLIEGIIPEPDVSFDESKYKSIKAVMDACITLDDSEAFPAVKYLENRGLSGILFDLPSLYFHPELAYWEDGHFVGKFPCLIGVVENDNGIISVHRTYLAEDGSKASVSSPKKLMSPTVPGTTLGASIRLYNAASVLHVTEGIETALAVRIATQGSVWAAISSNGLARLQLPAHIDELHIWADKDRSQMGQKSACQLAKRLLGSCKAFIHIPEYPIPNGKKGVDWLNVLNMKGHR